MICIPNHFDHSTNNWIVFPTIEQLQPVFLDNQSKLKAPDTTDLANINRAMGTFLSFDNPPDIGIPGIETSVTPFINMV